MNKGSHARRTENTWCAFSCANLSGFYNFPLVIPYVLEMLIMPPVKGGGLLKQRWFCQMGGSQ